MPIKAYKGFNKDMTCRGFQFKEGESYEEPEAKLCESGFHACLNPLDCFGYYSPATSEFHEVELDDISDELEVDTKVCAKKIKIGAKLDVLGICKAHFEFVKSQTTNEQIGSDKANLSGGDRSSLSGGDGSSLSGGYGSSLSGGDESSLSGGYGSSLSGGDGSSLSGGDRSSLSGGDGSSLSGGYGSSLSGGDGSSLSGGYGSSLSGGYGSSLSGGDRSSLSGRGKAQSGENSIISIRGNGCKAKGGIGTVIVIVNEYDDNYDIAEWKAGIIDGETLKPDTWYRLENGEFVECEDDAE